MNSGAARQHRTEPGPLAGPQAAVRARLHAPREEATVVAVIPARGGSKGIPRKNIADLAGKPLIAYSIEAALAARLVDRVVVSTDDPEIAEAALRHGAEVPFLRPAEMARDNSLVCEAVDYTLDRLYGGNRRLASVVLYPSSPFRTPGLIDHLVDKVLGPYSMASTVKRLERGPSGMLFLGRDGRLDPLPPSAARPEAGSPLYRPYGLVTVSRNYGAFNPYVHVIRDRTCLVDIDYPEDLRLAEAIIRRGLFDFFPEEGPC